MSRRPVGLQEYSTDELLTVLQKRGAVTVTFRNVTVSDQYLCQSYIDDAGTVQDCTCGKCEKAVV